MGGRSGSFWWREMAKIRDGLGGFDGGWFQDYVSWKVGDRVDTFFWHDPWLGGVPSGVRFRRLFEIAVDKSCFVSHMSTLWWEEGGDVEVDEVVVGMGGGHVRGVYHFTFLVFLCRLMLQIPRGGIWSLLQATLLVAPISN